MRETLEQLKAIRDGAPKRATIVDIEKCGYVDYMYYDKSMIDGSRIRTCTNDSDSAIEYSNGNIRSLSDIERQIELLELIDDIRALGFLEESHDSGVSHRKVCKRAKELLG